MDANQIAPRFRYQVESVSVAQGRQAWSVFEERPDGRRVKLASGTVLTEAGATWDHQELLTFLQKAEARRATN